MCVHSPGEVAWLLSCRGREVSSIPPCPGRVPDEPPGMGSHWTLSCFLTAPQQMLWAHLIQGFAEIVNPWLVVTWLGGLDWSCSITSITMRFLEKNCQLCASGLRLPCQVFCFTPREVNLIPFPVFQGSVEIAAAAECKVLSACCHVHAVI